MPVDTSAQPFLTRNEFLIRRLHSLSGLIPVGAYMTVHLSVNASIINGEATFQENVYSIHALGGLLPFVEWTFIFLPILFHASVGVFIVAGGLPNTTQYRYGPNIRYSLQRYTGMIAFVFIMLHVAHMHGWFHNEAWLNQVVRPWGGARFKPYHATSTAGEALQAWGAVALYVVGIVASTFHLANGIWTAGITWGVWTSDKAQIRAGAVCAVFGVRLTLVGMAALFVLRGAVDTPEEMQMVRQTEDKMLQHRREAGYKLDPHKEAAPLDSPQDSPRTAQH